VKRTKLSLVSKEALTAEQPYNIRMAESVVEQIRTAKDRSSIAWSDWVSAAAIKRLNEESDLEIESLVAQAAHVAGARSDKVSLPFRVRIKDIDTARAMATKYDASIQSVLIAALHLYSYVSLHAGLVVDDQKGE
jgi:hypothetical protein